MVDKVIEVRKRGTKKWYLRRLYKMMGNKIYCFADGENSKDYCVTPEAWDQCREVK